MTFLILRMQTRCRDVFQRKFVKCKHVRIKCICCKKKHLFLLFCALLRMQKIWPLQNLKNALQQPLIII